MSHPQDLPATLTVLTQHPLVADRLTRMRERQLDTAGFRGLVRALSWPLAFEATRDLALESRRIETPMAAMDAPLLAGPPPCLIAIWRAGSGLVEGMLDVLPEAVVGHLGMYRDEQTLNPVAYYRSLPARLDERLVILCDPMLATGGSAVAAVAQIVEGGARPERLVFACLLAAPEGVRTLAAAYPMVRILTAGLDSHLNESGYIVPGLGDAGDRQFGTS